MKGQSHRTIAGKPQKTTECFKCGSKDLVEAIPFFTLACLKCDAEMSTRLPNYHTYDNIDFKGSCHKLGHPKPL